MLGLLVEHEVIQQQASGAQASQVWYAITTTDYVNQYVNIWTRQQADDRRSGLVQNVNKKPCQKPPLHEEVNNGT